MPDLFPETLLVTRHGEHIYTTSRKVAEHFGKRHADVLRAIEKLLTELAELEATERNFAFSEADMEVDRQRNFALTMSPVSGPKGAVQLADPVFTEPNFGLSTYLDSTGRSLPEYHLSHDGFALLAMGFTGREALRWKVAFLAAFRQQEAALADMQARYLAALDVIRPSLRPTVQDAQAGLPRAATAQRLGKSVNAISYHRGQGRHFGLLADVAVRRVRGAA